MSVAVEAPAPEFAVRGVMPDPQGAVPVLRFQLGVTDASGRPVYTIALSAQIQIDADRRSYSPDTRERLVDLLGSGERIPETAGALQLGRVDVLVPSFTGEGSFDLALPCSADLELATTRYLSALQDGAVPLTFNFAGTIFYSGEHDRLQLTQVPWSCTARYRVLASTWRDLIRSRHAAAGFVRLQPETLELLRARRAALGLPTLDAAIADALREAE